DRSINSSNSVSPLCSPKHNTAHVNENSQKETQKAASENNNNANASSSSTGTTSSSDTSFNSNKSSSSSASASPCSSITNNINKKVASSFSINDLLNTSSKSKPSLPSVKK